MHFVPKVKSKVMSIIFFCQFPVPGDRPILKSLLDDLSLTPNSTGIQQIHSKVMTTNEGDEIIA